MASGPRPLSTIVHTPDHRDEHPGARHDDALSPAGRRSPMRQASEAATTGTPGGHERHERRRDRRPRQRRDHRAAPAQLAGQQRKEERREGGVEPEVLGVAEQRSGGHAERRAGHPRAVEGQAGPEQQPRVIAPTADVAHRPRLVDHELRAQAALPRRSAQ